MDIRPIRTDDDHRAALEEIEALWGAAEGTPEGDLLDVLATLVEAYEAGRWPIEELDPVEAIEAAMAAEGRSRADLAGLIGQSRATEILQRRRPLTLPMIRKIAEAWGVPERILVKDYALAWETTETSGRKAGDRFAARERYPSPGSSTRRKRHISRRI
jgi:HTH-type transcriptional regulator / antitoxin HigA